MKNLLLFTGMLIGLPFLNAAVIAEADEAPEPIQSVEIGAHLDVRVNGKPFFPIMSWLQHPDTFPTLRECGINTFCGNQSGITSEMQCNAASKAGGYCVTHFDDSNIGNPYLLAWIHGDEPDMPTPESDVIALPHKKMKEDYAARYHRLIDGVNERGTLIEPLSGAEFTIKMSKPAVIKRIVFHSILRDSLSSIDTIAVTGNGRELLRANLEKRESPQSFDLPGSSETTELTFRVISTRREAKDAGMIGEIEGFDSRGDNVLRAHTYYLPRKPPEESMEFYETVTRTDKSRPLMMTLTAHFMKEFSNRFDEATKRKLYPEFIKACDFPGFDTYPIYGWNMPKALNYPALGVAQLLNLTEREKPVYAWIETSKGSRWVPLEDQLDVLPCHTRFEVWGSIIRGATAIGYFTHRWRPDFKEFSPTPEMQAELKRLNNQITRLAPAILAEPVTSGIGIKLNGGLPAHLKATKSDGVLYIFAQNIDLGENAEQLGQGDNISPRAASATITVPDLASGKIIEVVDEDRTLRAEDGFFRDDFPPLGEHIYMIRL